MHAAPLYCKDVTVSLTERGLAKILNERNLRPDPMRCLRASALRSTSRAKHVGGGVETVPKARFEASLLKQALPGPSKRYIRWWQRAFGL